MAAAELAAAAHEERNRRAQADRDGWMAGREEAGQQARSAAYAAALREGKGAPQAHAAASNRGAAVLRFEAAHPLPAGLPEALLLKPRGLVGRVVGRLRRGSAGARGAGGVMVEEMRPAQQQQRHRAFPDEWGPPPAGDEHERSAWILEQIGQGPARRAAGEEVRWLRGTTPAEARARLGLDAEAGALRPHPRRAPAPAPPRAAARAGLDGARGEAFEPAGREGGRPRQPLGSSSLLAAPAGPRRPDRRRPAIFLRAIRQIPYTRRVPLP